MFFHKHITPISEALCSVSKLYFNWLSVAIPPGRKLCDLVLPVKTESHGLRNVLVSVWPAVLGPKKSRQMIGIGSTVCFFLFYFFQGWIQPVDSRVETFREQETQLLPKEIFAQPSSLLFNSAAAVFQTDQRESEAGSGSGPKWLGLCNNLWTFQERSVLSSAVQTAWLNCLI